MFTYHAGEYAYSYSPAVSAALMTRLRTLVLVPVPVRVGVQAVCMVGYYVVFVAVVVVLDWRDWKKSHPQ